MNTFYRSALLGLILLLNSVAVPVSAAQTGTVTASAVVTPAQTIRLSFMTSALIKDITVKEGDHVTAGQTLATLNTPDLEYNVTAAQEAYRSAQTNADLQRHAKVKDYRNGRKFWDPVPAEIWQKAQAQADSAQAAVEEAQAVLALTTLTAPQDAVVASMDAIPGQLVQQGQVVMTLATLDQLQLETTDLSERDIAKVKAGAPVNISIEALNKTFTGKVVSISPRADTVGGDTVFRVTMAFDEQPQDLLWGMTAEVTINEP
jgi:HlyD family secretion protein/macrolide-specific efflux system membrane fusion protein